MKKLNKLATMLTVSTMLISSISPALAQIYTDVPNSHWANTYITNMNKQGVIAGYPDATFRPNESITREQAMVMISRIMKPKESEKLAALNKHKTYLTGLGASTWAQKDIAYAIEKDIIKQSDVKKFYYNKKATKITREELCIYLTRVMGKEKEAQNASIIVMSFIDQQLIGDAALKYVYIIQNLGIVQGTPDNKFNPKGVVTRAAMAKMLDLSYKELQKNGGTSSSTNNNTKPDNTKIESKEIEGKIDNILNSGKDRIHIYVKTSRNKQELIRVDKDADVKFGKKRIDYDELKQGYEVEISYKVMGSENIATKVEMSSVEESIRGTIYDVRSGRIVIETDDEKETYELSDRVEVDIDGKESRESRLEEDQKGVFKIENGEVTEIDVISKNSSIKGVIDKIDTKDSEIRIETEDEKSYTYEIDEDEVDIEKDGDDVDFDELEEDDEVVVTLKYNEVYRIEARMVEKEIEGYITSISIDGDDSKIKVEDKKNKTYEIIVDKDTDIELDNDDADLYDLRIGYSVEIEMKGKKAETIEAEVKFKEDKIEGNVYKVYDDFLKLYLDKDGKRDEDRDRIRVSIGKNTKIIRGDDEIKLKNIDRDDEVIIIGTYEDEDEFEAKSIIVIEY